MGKPHGSHGGRGPHGASASSGSAITNKLRGGPTSYELMAELPRGQGGADDNTPVPQKEQPTLVVDLMCFGCGEEKEPVTIIKRLDRHFYYCEECTADIS